jgi:hypothetical protein
MYAKLPGGHLKPGGYVVPCDVVQEVKDERGGLCGAYVQLGDSTDMYRMQIYVAADQLMNDDEVENV